MRSKAILSVLIGLALLLSFSVAVKDAKADALLFPWIVKSSQVSTLVSVVNTAEKDPGVLPMEVLHYQYWYKKSTANTQTEACDNISFKRPTSKDDIVTFDAAGNINGGKALFNDPGAGTWKGGPSYGTQSFKLNVESPRRAFLIVDNNTPALALSDTNVDGTLYGEAMVVELVGGAAWGYIAYNPSGGETEDQNARVRFGDMLDVLGEVIGIDETTQTVLLPPDTIITRFFMTPISDEYWVAPNQRAGNLNTRIQLCLDPTQTGGCTQGGIYDNDEGKIDFEKKKDIVCTSADDLVKLMTEASYNTFKATGGQGWSYIITLPGTLHDDFDMIIGKLELTTTGVTIDGKTVPGTLNNFLWIRDSETVTDCVGINCIHNETAY
ncbi:MAG: hypothetical protein FJ242_00785 [Nitrospira sp.]|nr:hypothetical protein [Nitrospira sp.]